MKFLYAACITAIISSVFISLVYNNHMKTKHDIYYNTAVVTNIGQCNDGVCSYTYKTEFGEIRYGKSSQPVSVNQTLYRECWTEKARGKRCYTEYTSEK